MREGGWRRVAALGAAVLVCAGACVGTEGLSDAERQDIDPLIIGGGGSTGIYSSYGAGLADALTDRLGVTATAEETGGSIENLIRLSDGRAQLAFSAADAAADAAAGREPFDTALPVRAIARVYDDFVHLVVPESSAIDAIDDLRGRTVSLGAEGSGTELIARRLLMVAEVDPASIDDVPLGIDGSIEALRSGEIEAFFWSGGIPTPGLDDLARGLPIRLIPLDDLVEGARARYGGGYRHGVVPEGTYGLAEDVATMAVPNFLMVHEDLPDDVAYQMLETLFDERADIAARAPAAALLDRRRSIFTEPVDLHPGALRYYRDTKT